MGRQEGGAHCRVLNIGFRLINWAENGAWERPPIQQQVFAESGSVRYFRGRCVAAAIGIETSIVALNIRTFFQSPLSAPPSLLDAHLVQ